jgi:uncharacterized protein YndB with AHSA1/START domain
MPEETDKAGQSSAGEEASGGVRRSVLLPAPVESVWAALTDAEQLSAWLGGDVEIDPVPGGQITLQEDGRLRRGVILDLNPLRRVEIGWLPRSVRLGFIWKPDEAPAGSGGAVEFLLEPLPEYGATWLTVIERAPTTTPAALAVA